MVDSVCVHVAMQPEPPSHGHAALDMHTAVPRVKSDSAVRTCCHCVLDVSLFQGYSY